MNRLLFFVAGCELVPQRVLGTSVMVVLQNQT
jgi:hypothetical protein